MAASAANNRLLLIGLDAADRGLIEAWCAEGLLPNLARIQAQGVWSSLETTADTLHVSAWPSIFSGTTPDKHGLYHAYVMQPGQQNPARPRPDLCPVPFLWKLLDGEGKRCIVMDAFLTCPVQDFSGVQIVDWGSWTWFWKQTTILPASVKHEIARRFGGYPAENHSQVGMTPPPDPEGFRERLVNAVRKKTEVIEWLIETQEWDFFLAVFGECHAAGHYFWHYQDSEYVAYPASCSDVLRTALRDVYIELDTAIGALLERVGDDTTVLITSGDGMGPNYSGSHILNDLLARMELINAGGAAKDAGSRGDSGGGGGRKNFLSTLRGMVPKEFRAAVSRHLLPRAINERLSLHWKTAGIDWANTRAFAIENANEGYVRVNLRGREPQGVVEPGEYDAVCASLVEAATSMTNPDNGMAAATHVHRARELFHGPCCEQMPDVIINWDPEARILKELVTASYGTAASPEPGYNVSPYYTGNHRPNAFLAATGSSLDMAGSLADASILDLAPSILDHFGIQPPEHMDGRILDLL